MFDTFNPGFLASKARVIRVEYPADIRKTYRWQMAGASEGTHRTLCFRHLSHAKAFPILPSLASIVRMELAGLGDLGDASVSAG